MNNNNNMNYIKTDDNKIINEQHIRWVKKMNECLQVCTITVGCSNSQLHNICKINSSSSYSKLNKYFEE